METNLINPTIDLKIIIWGTQDDHNKQFKGIKNIRQYIDEDKNCIEKSINLSDFTINKCCRCYIDTNNNYAFDYVLKLPYIKDLEIYNDIITNIRWVVGGQGFVTTNMNTLKFQNWLFDKEIKIKDGYLYLPLSNNINLYNTSCASLYNYEILVYFTDKYMNFFKNLNENNPQGLDSWIKNNEENKQGLDSWIKNNEENTQGLYSWIMNGFKDIQKTIKPKLKIELLYKEYSFSENELIEKLNFNPKQNEQKFIQNQINSKSIEGKTNDIVNVKFCFNHPTFCLFIYGFDKDDISDVQFVINDDNYVYDMILKEKIENIYVLEFADPLLFNKLLSEPMTNTDIFNKKTINFSRIDTCRIRFKKTNNKSFEFNIVGLSYNFIRIVGNMAGIAYSN